MIKVTGALQAGGAGWKSTSYYPDNAVLTFSERAYEIDGEAKTHYSVIIEVSGVKHQHAVGEGEYKWLQEDREKRCAERPAQQNCNINIERHDHSPRREWGLWSW